MLRTARISFLMASLGAATGSCGSRTGLTVGRSGDDGAAARGGNADAAPTGPVARSISVSWDHACAITAGGNVACWGATSDGTVGPATAPYVPPTVVQGVNRAAEVGTGQLASCALDLDGSTWCWGNVVGSPLPRKVPLPVANHLFVGEATACVVTDAGMASCTGRPIAGDGCTSGAPASFDDVVSVALDDIRELALGSADACALRSDGSVWCWGCNEYGALGDPARTSANAPTRVPGIDAVQLATNTSAVCVLTRSGQATCWGDGSQFGTSLTVAPTAPVNAPFAANAFEVKVGVVFSCAAFPNQVSCDGALYNFGSGCNQHDVAKASFEVSGVRAISVGYQEACTRTAPGTVFCWGCNSTQVLGRPGPGTGSPTEVALPP